MIFGDHHLAGFPWNKALPVEAKDKYGVAGPFYNWGLSSPPR